jgi:hypothetical protein
MKETWEGDIVACRLLGNNKVSNYTTAITKKGFTNRSVSTATVGYNNTETMFFVWSMPRCYKQDTWSNELVVRQSPAGKNVNMEAEDIVAIRHQAMTGEEIAN